MKRTTGQLTLIGGVFFDERPRAFPVDTDAVL